MSGKMKEEVLFADVVALRHVVAGDRVDGHKTTMSEWCLRLLAMMWCGLGE